MTFKLSTAARREVVEDHLDNNKQNVSIGDASDQQVFCWVRCQKRRANIYKDLMDLRNIIKKSK